MSEVTTAEQHFDVAVAALEAARRHTSPPEKLVESRMAAARAYVAVILLLGGRGSGDDRRVGSMHLSRAA